MDALKFIRSINKALNFPVFWENEVLLNMLFYLFHLFIYKLVISWRDVTEVPHTRQPYDKQGKLE